MAGGQPPEQMHKYYRLADLVVVPSQVEDAFCMVAVEARAAGKPVLASLKGGINEIVLELSLIRILASVTVISPLACSSRAQMSLKLNVCGPINTCLLYTSNQHFQRLTFGFARDDKVIQGAIQRRENFSCKIGRASCRERV